MSGSTEISFALFTTLICQVMSSERVLLRRQWPDDSLLVGVLLVATKVGVDDKMSAGRITSTQRVGLLVQGFKNHRNLVLVAKFRYPCPTDCAKYDFETDVGVFKKKSRFLFKLLFYLFHFSYAMVIIL